MAEGLSQRTDALDVIVGLLGALDGSGQSGREFYNRLCEACCRLVVGGRRTSAFLEDPPGRSVVLLRGRRLRFAQPAGHGVNLTHRFCAA